MHQTHADFRFRHIKPNEPHYVCKFCFPALFDRTVRETYKFVCVPSLMTIKKQTKYRLRTVGSSCCIITYSNRGNRSCNGPEVYLKIAFVKVISMEIRKIPQQLRPHSIKKTCDFQSNRRLTCRLLLLKN